MVWNRSMKCIFCGKKADSAEHIWGQWLKKIYPTDDIVPKLPHYEDRNDKDGKAVVARGHHHGGADPLYKTSKVVCVDCNTGWMSKIEENAKNVFVKVFKDKGKKLSSNDAIILAKWISLKFCIQEVAEEFLVPEGISNTHLQTQFLDICEIQRAERNGEFFKNVSLGGSFAIFVGRSYGKGQIGGRNPIKNSGPITITDGRIDAFVSLSTCLLFVGPMHCVLSNDERVVHDIRRWISTDGVGSAALKELRPSARQHLQRIGVGSDVLEEFVLGSIEKFDPRKLRRNFGSESVDLKVVRPRKRRQK